MVFGVCGGLTASPPHDHHKEKDAFGIRRLLDSVAVVWYFIDGCFLQSHTRKATMETKTCSRCNQERPIDQFNKNKRYKDGYLSWCKPCMKEYQSKWYPENAERISKKYADKYRNDDEFRKETNERNNERCRDRWHNDPEYRARKNKQKRDKYHSNPVYRAWRIALATLAVMVRRERIAKTGEVYTQQEWRDLCAKYDHRCLKCGEKKKLVPDHVVPVSKGGGNTIANIQPLCEKCNLEKFTKETDYRE